jgi:anti-sigma regulatory factor (Ser/Thr protein kinase)
VLEPDATLIVYSDGLVERRGEHLDTGLRRLESAAALLADLPVDEVCDRLVADLGLASSRQDDVAVLVVRLAAAREPAFRSVFPARPAELRALRTSLRAWLDERGIADPAFRHALLLAVGEACANSAEHAYAGQDDGDVTVEITDEEPGSFQVEIRDRGRFGASSPDPDRGRGTTIMRGLTTGFSRESSPAGTTVRFQLPLHDPVPT